MAAARSAIELNPMNFAGHEALGHVLLESDRNAEAAAAFQRALCLVPHYEKTRDAITDLLRACR